MASSSSMPKREHDYGSIDGIDFRGWEKKRNLLLTMLNIVYGMSMSNPEEIPPIPILTPSANAANAKACRDMMNTHKVYHKWDKNECVCRGHIVHGMMDALFDVLETVELSRELWEHFVSIAHKMVDDHSSMNHFDELRKVFQHCVHTEYNLWLESQSGRQGDKVTPKKSDVGMRGFAAMSNKEKCWRCGKAGHMKRDCHYKVATATDASARGASASLVRDNPGQGMISNVFVRKFEMFEFF